jgi:hypothetical protein
MAWITIHFGRKPRNGGSPPRDRSDVNIMNFISVASLLVIRVWLIKDTPESLIADSTVMLSMVYTFFFSFQNAVCTYAYAYVFVLLCYVCYVLLL